MITIKNHVRHKMDKQEIVNVVISDLKKGDTHKINCLLDYVAKKNIKDENGDTALMFALNEGQLEIAKVLIKHGANVNAKNNDGETPLIIAVIFAIADYGREVETVKLLIKSGADINAQNNNDMTALDMIEVYTEYNKNVKNILIAHGGLTGKNIREYRQSRRSLASLYRQYEEMPDDIASEIADNLYPQHLSGNFFGRDAYAL